MLLLLVSSVFAYSAGKTGSSTTGCGACHGSSASSATTSTFSTSDTVVEPGETINVSLVVSHASLGGAGLNVSATGGTLGAGSNTRVSAGEVTHSSTRTMSGGAVTFNFTWTAPATEGSYALRGVGNAVDRDGAGDTDDKWNLASNLTLTVDDGCEDDDGDGYEECDDGSGADCDDSDNTVYPGAPETCDGEDEDCDGTIDESPSTGGTQYWRDADSDGYGAGSAVRSCSALSGYVTNDDDCDDTSAAVSPADAEVCNGVDDDCDGSTDEASASDAATWYRDADADGYGTSATTSIACSTPTGYVGNDDDCDDARGSVNPGATEVCDARDLDEDCDGAADDDDVSVTGTTAWYADADADGYGDSTIVVLRCEAPGGYTATPGDCLDTDAAFNPGAVESCDDPTDYNCDGATGYADDDGDGVAACEDCDDGDASAFPGAEESCNGVDDDCDGTVDEDDAVDALTWYLDADLDGYGTSDETTLACEQPDGYDDDALDCDDADDTVRPDAPEVWYDGIDQNCDGRDDDQDEDGFGAAEDCDDTSAAVYPGAVEVWYDGIDQDCDGNDDDQDGDGVGVATDCDDEDPTVTTCGDTGDTDTGDTGDTDTGDTDTGDTDTGDTDTAETGDTTDTDTDQGIGDPPADTEEPPTEACAGCASPAGSTGGLTLAAMALAAAFGRRRGV